MDSFVGENDPLGHQKSLEKIDIRMDDSVIGKQNYQQMIANVRSL